VSTAPRRWRVIVIHHGHTVSDEVYDEEEEVLERYALAEVFIRHRMTGGTWIEGDDREG
jgi:hypothetical protein